MISRYLLYPFDKVYVATFRLRERFFGYDVKYNIFPDSFIPHAIPVHMDPIWIRRGFFGYNKAYVPKGTPHSERFNENSRYFQSWVGTYYLRTARKFEKGKKSELIELGGAAIEDQKYWMMSYGVLTSKVEIIESSLKKVEQKKQHDHVQDIYYGEMHSDVEDSYKNNLDFPIFHSSAVRITSDYNDLDIHEKLLSKDPQPSANSRVKLFGYFSIINLTSSKYLLTYACGAEKNAASIQDELYDVISNIEVIKR